VRELSRHLLGLLRYFIGYREGVIFVCGVHSVVGDIFIRLASQLAQERAYVALDSLD
jgi:hypothetical protein